MELVRIIFYDTRDGAVFFNIVDNIENIDVYKNLLIQKYGSSDNMSCIVIDSNLYIEEFNKGMYCRIFNNKLYFTNKDTVYNLGSKSTLNDRWHPLFENLYDLRSNNNYLMKMFYNDYINYNFKAICNVGEPLWLDFKQLERFEDRNNLPLFNNQIFPDIDTFALDILNNGFIFPLHVTNRNDVYKIYDGGHRYEACKYLYNNNLWDNRKILCINIKAINVKFINNPSINYELDSTIKMHIPTLLLKKYGFINFLSKKEFNEYITEVEVNKYLDVMILARMYITEMTRTCSDYKFDESIILNNQLLFNSWMKGDFKL